MIESLGVRDINEWKITCIFLLDPLVNALKQSLVRLGRIGDPSDYLFEAELITPEQYEETLAEKTKRNKVSQWLLYNQTY